MQKLFMSGLVTLFAMFSVFSSLSADSLSNDNTDAVVMAKRELIKYAENKIKTSTIKEISEDRVNYLLAKSVAENDPSIASSLEEYGVFKLELPESIEVDRHQIFTDNSSISMTTPVIYYDSTAKEWLVVGGGSWKNDAWTSYIPNFWSGNVGTTQNVGGRDGFGVAYTNTGKNYTTKVTGSYGYISDGDGHEVTTTSRSDGDGKQGVGFQLQDKIRMKKLRQ